MANGFGQKSRWALFSRRKMLGGLMIGGGAVLGGLGLRAYGADVARRGRILLDGLPQIPPGLEAALQFPLVEALLGRRARRFSVGAEIPAGPLAYKSQHPPRPLEPLEQMLVLTAAAGNTGWQNLIPFNPNYAPHIPNYAVASGGRTFPSAAGFQTIEFFYTDDDGTYFLPTREAPSLATRNAEGQLNLNDYLNAHRARIKKLSDKRLYFPPKPQHLEMHNPWCVNRPGSTLVIPVADLARHHIAQLCYLVQNGACMFDDVNKSPIPGMEKFKDLVDVDNPYPLTFMEQFTLTEATVEIGTSCYAGMLMLQAIGLGGWMFDGISPFSMLGASGDPEVPGLGFRFDTDDRWPLPNVTGLPGVLEGHCPPHYSNMRAAVEEVVRRKFGPGGPFNAATPGPYRETAQVRAAGERHDEHFIDCVTTMADYVYNRFGKFPGTVPTMFVLMHLQAHHLDLDFYDTKFGPGAYLATHANHDQQWHT
jgi:hypothetical protein